MKTILHDDEKKVDPRIEEEYQAYQPELPPGKEEKDEGFVVCNGPEYDPLGDVIRSAARRPGKNRHKRMNHFRHRPGTNCRTRLLGFYS